MVLRNSLRFAVCVAFTVSANIAWTANRWGLATGTVSIHSSGPLSFGPDGILLVGDPATATVYAIGTEEKAHSQAIPADIDNLTEQLKGVFEGKELTIVDMAVNPVSRNVYFSLSVSHEGKSQPRLVRLDPAGHLTNVSLEKVEFARVSLPNAASGQASADSKSRSSTSAITDIAYLEGRVYVSGITAAGKSNVWEVMLPFTESGEGTTVEIFHAAHGRVEDNAAVRTFIPLNIDGQPSLLAGFTCTPLVRFSIDTLKGGEKVRGTTVAELGNRNQPLDMIQYSQEGKEYILMTNSKRGVMKISLEDVGRENGLTEKVSGGGTAGQSFTTISSLPEVNQLDRLDNLHAVAVVSDANGTQSLKVFELP